MNRKIIKNILANGGAFFVEAVTAFLLMPYVIKYLGDSEYGIWILINALTGYLGIFKLGFRPSINKHVSEYNALGNFVKMRSFLANSVSIYIIASFIIVFVSIVVGVFLFNLLNIPEEYIQVTRVLIIFAGVHSALSLYSTAYGGVISGYQRYEINAAIEVAVIIIRAMIIYYGLPYYTDILYVAITHFGITILGFFATVIFAKRIAPISKLPLFKFDDREVIQRIVKFNSISFGISILAILIIYADTFVVGSLFTTVAVTHYAVGARLYKYINDFLSVVTRVISPAISEYQALKKEDKIKFIYIKGTKISTFIAYPILVICLTVGDKFIGLWMGSGYEDSYKILLILTIAGFILLPQQIVNPVLYGMAKHSILLKQSVLELIFSLPIAIVLGNQYGLEGVAIGLMLPRVILKGFIFAVYVVLMLGISLRELFVDAYLKIVVSIIPFAIFLEVTSRYLEYSWLVFSAQVGVASVVYIITIYLVALDKREKELVLGYLNKRAFK